MLGFPLIMHKKLFESNLEVSSPIKTAAGYFKSEAEPDKGIGPLFPPLESRQPGLAKLFLPFCHTDGTLENIPVTTTTAAAAALSLLQYAGASSYHMLLCEIELRHVHI